MLSTGCGCEFCVEELADRGTYYEIEDYEPIVELDNQGNVVSIINCPYIPKFFIEGLNKC